MKLKINQGIENKFYTVFIVVIGICLITFFTSKLWMHDDNPIDQTPFHTEILGLDQTALVLNKWEYNPDKGFMEVSLTTKHTGSDAVKPTLSFATKDRETRENYPVKIIYNDGTYIVVHIYEIPEKYKVIGLFVKETRDKNTLENEIKTLMSESSMTGSLDQDGGEEEIKLPKPKERIIIGDYRKIKTNNSLVEKSIVDYQVEQIEREIKQVDNQILILQDEKIPHQNSLVHLHKNEIKELEEGMKYETEQEKQETESKIRLKNESIKNAQKLKEEYEENVNVLNEKKDRLLEKLEDVLSNESDKELKEDEPAKEKVEEDGVDEGDDGK